MIVVKTSESSPEWRKPKMKSLSRKKGPKITQSSQNKTNKTKIGLKINPNPNKTPKIRLNEREGEKTKGEFCRLKRTSRFSRVPSWPVHGCCNLPLRRSIDQSTRCRVDAVAPPVQDEGSNPSFVFIDLAACCLRAFYFQAPARPKARARPSSKCNSNCREYRVLFHNSYQRAELGWPTSVCHPCGSGLG